MNILHVYKCSKVDSEGGVENFIHTHCNHTSVLGCQNVLLSLSRNPPNCPVAMNGYTVHCAKQNLFIASTGISIPGFGKFRKLASEADIVHYHFPNPYADLLHFLCRPKKPSVVTYHSDIMRHRLLHKFYHPLQQWFLASVDRIVATSPNYFVTSETLKNFGDKVTIIPIGIDHDKVNVNCQKHLNYWRNRLQQPFFLFIGVMRYYKGLHIALDAVAETSIRIVIAGVGDLEKELKAKAASLNLDNVEFLGQITDDDKAALLQLCHGFIFPSYLRSEAFGISLLEAASAGKPMISCEIGTGTSFVNVHSETGLVVPPNSALKLKKAMEYMLDNPDAAAAMGQNAKKRSQETFSAEHQAAKYVQLYRELIFSYYPRD